MERLIKNGDQAQIKASGEIGQVVGTADFLHGRTQYLLRYCNNVGVAVEQWWDEDAIITID